MRKMSYPTKPIKRDNNYMEEPDRILEFKSINEMTLWGTGDGNEHSGAKLHRHAHAQYT